MKRAFLFVIFTALLLAGCKNSKDTVLEVKESEYKNIDINKVNVSMNFSYSTKPEIATWGPEKEKLNSLDEATKWGDSLYLKMTDITSLDLTKDNNRLKNITFDTMTKWPDKLPKGFDPAKILELGKNPGLGIRKLQAQGITGKGVNIAIIDEAPLLEHKEYGNQFKLYDEINVLNPSAGMHGSFVASISVGKTCGVAPDASLYFIGCINQSQSSENNKNYLDFTHYAKAVDKILEINKELPDDQKIRVLSISASWCPENVGYKEITGAVMRAKKEGIFVVSCNMFENYGFWDYGLGRESSSDPDNPKSYKVYDWKTWINYDAHIPGFVGYYEKVFLDKFNSEILLIPVGSRTYADPHSDTSYSFDTSGSFSMKVGK